MNEEGKELTVDFLMNQLAIEDCNAQHKILSQLNSSSSMNFAAYNHRQNKGKSNKSKCISGKNVGQNILECRLLQITTTHLENPQEWKESVVYEMWKARAPARPEMCSQECKVQGVPQNWTFLHFQEKRQESQSCPDTTSS